MDYSPDDPFAPAPALAPAPAPGKGRPEVTAPVEEERLAERDPDAAPETSAEYRAAGAASLDELFRRARAKGFLAGVAAGAVGAAMIAIGLALTSAREAPRATAGFRPHMVEPSPAAPPAIGESTVPSPGRGAPPPGKSRRPQASEGAFAAEQPIPVADAGEPREVAPAPVPGRSPDQGVEPVGAAAPPPSVPPAPAPPEPSEAAPSPDAARDAVRPGPPPAAEDVARALRARRPALAGCLAATPGGGSAGRSQAFLLTLVIDPSGRVSEAQVDDPEIEAAPLGTCLVRLARAMSFAPFEGGPHRVELALDYGDPG